MEIDARTKIEAAAFRSLAKHLQHRNDVQNIDLMNLAGFCRTCLSKWLHASANENSIDLDYDTAREMVYGMPFNEWKQQNQKEASAEQKENFEKTKPLHAVISGHK
ncbi:MAG: alkaline phosphatase [Acidiferrobacteraceae bacterium]|nr:alkaline phosphatase [Acidiferrobacteraceae bacterium]